MQKDCEVLWNSSSNSDHDNLPDIMPDFGCISTCNKEESEAIFTATPCVTDAQHVQPCLSYEGSSNDEQAFEINGAETRYSEDYIEPRLTSSSSLSFGCHLSRNSNASSLDCSNVVSKFTTDADSLQIAVAASNTIDHFGETLLNLQEENKTFLKEYEHQCPKEKQMPSSDFFQPDYFTMNCGASNSVSFDEYDSNDLRVEVLHKNALQVGASAVESYKKSPLINVIITMAILASPMYRCRIASIYLFIQRTFPFFCSSSADWKKVIRQAVRVNKCFVAFPNKNGIRRNLYWGIDRSSQQFQEMQSYGIPVLLGQNETSSQTVVSKSNVQSGNNAHLRHLSNSLPSSNPTAVSPMTSSINIAPPSSQSDPINQNYSNPILYPDGMHIIDAAVPLLQHNDLGSGSVMMSGSASVTAFSGISDKTYNICSSFSPSNCLPLPLNTVAAQFTHQHEHPILHCHGASDCERNTVVQGLETMLQNSVLSGNRCLNKLIL